MDLLFLALTALCFATVAGLAHGCAALARRRG
ncbi:hypothetical protein C7389_11831 [Azoarcus indigens]|uniref:Uncharacterized protein n=1 Tax=Azoarcus indigens TaxID=29545 RepID=A0A4V3BLU6_9RHOO|nr:hypothetical protein C7389_11831 [Azoarcus indigens]